MKPTAGIRVYDPTADSGGMLIQTRNYLIEHYCYASEATLVSSSMAPSNCKRWLDGFMCHL